MFLYDALRIFENLNVDYGKMTKEEMDNLDNAIDEVRYAAECWERLTGGIKFKDYIARLNCEKLEEKIKGRIEKAEEVEQAIVNDNYLKLDIAEPYNFGELNIKFEVGDEIHLEPVTYGHWETPEPDYDREGNKLPIRVAICSECQKPNRLPVGRYCTECGSWNKGHERGDE